ncbi:MAG: SPFH domain-containing protein, partial [Clostridia bacterium]
QPAFARISEMGIRYSALPGHTMELADALNHVLSEKWTALRGLAIASFGISSLKASDEDEAMLKQLQRSAVMRDPTMAAATLVGAQSEAMVNAAKNQGTGPVMAFAGLNMASQAGGMNAQSLYAMGASQPKQGTVDTDSWTCSCGAVNKGKFCTECAKPRPVDIAGWTCSCGVINKGKFCMECGKPKPAGAKLYKCDKCGWELKEGMAAPKFCPECGDIFDDSDIVK